jgi:hypothetical protein
MVADRCVGVSIPVSVCIHVLVCLPTNNATTNYTLTSYHQPQEHETLCIKQRAEARKIEEEKDRRSRLPKPLTDEGRRLQKFRTAYRKMGMKPDF